ncbi:expressed unknown protein [Seminavis robusta]|uniref:Uncharacterized protein n=1 Tax=Seminavis robusta TaxID=568900 RepID=A0A9N8HSX7_9STRA|nr:expressed unknown protein [Seminavis robusta]|eukprot:Sro1583_g283950.1 n/a (251) ;mRNA; f:12071-12823
MEVRVVRFDQSAKKERTGGSKNVKQMRKRKGTRVSSPPLDLTAAAKIFETLKSNDRQNEVMGACKDDFIALAVRNLLAEVFEFDVTGGDIAQGLQRLQESPPSFVNLSAEAQCCLLRIHVLAPGMAKPPESSSISSNNFDQTVELEAFRVGITAALEAATKRGTSSEELKTEAEKIFHKDKKEGETALEYVIKESSWTGMDEAKTVDSLYDAMSTAACNAFWAWGNKHLFTEGYLHQLVAYVFIQQGAGR